MNSLHRSGHVTPASRINVRFSNEPWKYFSSVRTERHAAPPASYALAIFTGSKLGWMTPLDGDAFLTSAMRPGWPVDFHWSLMAPTKSRAGSWFWMAVRTWTRGKRSFCFASHSSLYQTISSRMFWGLFASLSMRSPFSLMVSILNANWSLPTSCLAWPNGGRRRMVTSGLGSSETDAIGVTLTARDLMARVFVARVRPPRVTDARRAVAEERADM
mmetsp:Transcript_3746/g.10149  ORF Transcript_3746/g.10149 Transcript_3746/m.10149 type:complete len:216 (+) Transcript_3746:574-1221(+)